MIYTKLVAEDALGWCDLPFITGREWRYVRLKRRTWRTLWLVPRTDRVKQILIRVQLPVQL